MHIIRSLQNRIYDLRGERVILDKDLASLFEVDGTTIRFIVQKSPERFPPDFMFQLTQAEYDELLVQIDTIEKNEVSTRLQPQMIQKGKQSPNTPLPYAFTIKGVLMLSGMLNSDRAVKLQLAFTRSLFENNTSSLQSGLGEILKQVALPGDSHLTDLVPVVEMLENLLDEQAARRKWENRERIGFKR